MNKELHNHHHDDHCSCGHDHHHDHQHCGCGCDHDHHDHEHISHDHSHNHDFDNISENDQRIYIVEGLDCANCAAKIERKIQAMPEVKAASITFATKQLRIAAKDPDSLLPKLEKACRSVEDNVKKMNKEDSIPA